METVCRGKNNNLLFFPRQKKKKKGGGNTGYRGPVRKNSDKQHGHETAT